MADLNVVPGTITLGCGGSTKVTVTTSDKMANVTIRTLGFDGAVVSVNPEEGTTNDKGYADFFVKCAGVGADCPATTTITFFAVDYDDDDLLVDCVDRGRPPDPPPAPVQLALALTPVVVTPRLLAEQLRALQRLDFGEGVQLREE